MTHYYFHLHSNIEVRDEEGCDFASLTEAITSSMKDVREMMAADINETGKVDMNHSLDIAVVSGQVLHVTRYHDCVTILPLSTEVV